MNERVYEIEKNIENLLSTGFAEKHNVVLEIARIPELPYDDFSDLKSDMISRKAIVRMAPGAIGHGVFSLGSVLT